VPPRSGRTVNEAKAVDNIVQELKRRRISTVHVESIELPVKITKSMGTIPDNIYGISELIGKATTPFTGSPKNRVSNIENGIKFLTGILIQPGEGFSTLDALGEVDDTTGYLPELVIKGDETIPEFGGGLCQVSTTLFRAVLNAGLPVSERQNHSYRVSYYEYNEDGNYIGPGLDATIYNPNPDLKFKNDTDSTILIYGYVEGDKATFELYGTKDGRTVEIEGPETLTVIPAGNPIYIDTNALAKGSVRKIETAHSGGSVIATYKVTYPDGTIREQEFKSWYKKWPAKYLVGIRE